MFCSVITKNSNWEILTKNIVTFKRQYGVKDEKLFGGFTEKSNFWGGGDSRKTNMERGLPKNGALDSLQI